MIKHNNGFTLIELLVTIAIISVLAAVAVPSTVNFLERANVTTDIAQLKMLNDATQAYSVMNSLYTGDIFDGFDTDDARMQELIDSGYFAEPVVPKKEGETYNWGVSSQSWTYSKYIIDDGNIFRIVFDENFTIEDYVSTNSDRWVVSEDGLEGSGWNSLLFIPNDRDEYTITTEAVLESGDGDGYGIMFDTSVAATEDNDYQGDTGYCLQFDRGYADGEIIIRERVDGNEYSPLVRVSHDDYPDLIPEDPNDSWWTESHEIQTEVIRLDDDTKAVSVTIDGTTVITEMEYETSIEASENNTGFRVWGDATQYQSITIE